MKLHDEDAQIESEKQGHGGDEHVLHDGSLPCEAVRTLRDAATKPEERGPIVKYNSLGLPDRAQTHRGVSGRHFGREAGMPHRLIKPRDSERLTP